MMGLKRKFAGRLMFQHSEVEAARVWLAAVAYDEEGSGGWIAPVGKSKSRASGRGSLHLLGIQYRCGNRPG
jgi:hypothetical protein